VKIVETFPPNVDKIRAVFPLTGHELFAYGDTIYHPRGGKLPPALIAHEEVHGRQQGDDVEGWWARYLVDPNFRLKMELEAHRVEYQLMVGTARTRNMRRLALSHIARKLSAPLYGRLITFDKAKKALKAEK